MSQRWLSSNLPVLADWLRQNTNALEAFSLMRLGPNAAFYIPVLDIHDVTNWELLGELCLGSLAQSLERGRPFSLNDIRSVIELCRLLEMTAPVSSLAFWAHVEQSAYRALSVIACEPGLDWQSARDAAYFLATLPEFSGLGEAIHREHFALLDAAIRKFGMTNCVLDINVVLRTINQYFAELTSAASTKDLQTRLRQTNAIHLSNIESMRTSVSDQILLRVARGFVLSSAQKRHGKSVLVARSIIAQNPVFPDGLVCVEKATAFRNIAILSLLLREYSCKENRFPKQLDELQMERSGISALESYLGGTLEYRQLGSTCELGVASNDVFATGPKEMSSLRISVIRLRLQ
ncbi:MAG: hypothetical protein L0Z55_10210 [Planctomycetes bacterium]|nr:hypothetical protein [Planctomycetota bacterium]